MDASAYRQIEEFKRQIVLRALIRTRGNKMQAARLLKIHRNVMNDWTKQLGLNDMVQKLRRAA